MHTNNLNLDSILTINYQFYFVHILFFHLGGMQYYAHSIYGDLSQVYKSCCI